jgi:serine/threonine protein kinase
VAFAHAHGIIHRDLKPQNIMLGAFGDVQVMDWGVAKELAEPHPGTNPNEGNGAVASGEHTAHGTILGTPGYMAPEQARGQVELVDEQADVYALGAILYFLLTGQAPSPGRLPKDDFLLPPRSHDRSIPRPLEAVCLKALAAERAERYASVLDLAGDITGFLAGRRLRAYPEGILGTALRLGRRYRTVAALIIAYLIMRIVLLMVF